MKISILGGTGGLGQGLALRWIQYHDIIVGSRLKQKADETIVNYNEFLKKFGKNNKGKLIAATNEEAVKNSDIILLSTPPEYTVEMVKNLKKYIPKDVLIISPVVPMKVESGIFSYKVDMMQKHGVFSAAEAISTELPDHKLVAAFHNLPAKELANLDKTLNGDVLIAGDDEKGVEMVAKLVTEINELRPLYCGSLQTANLIESITPLLLNVSRNSKLKHPYIKIVGSKIDQNK